MKLLIISNMSHYYRKGEIVGWGPTVQEIDHLSKIFTEIRHIACLHPGEAPASALPYSSDNISFSFLPPAGGQSWSDKLEILRLTPLYLRTILTQLPWGEAVHVRCPANISMFGILLLALVSRPRMRWVKYAGNWKPTAPESWTYTFQRWWLAKSRHRGIVTVNGRWPQQPPHVYTFPNPCLTAEEVLQGLEAGGEKELTNPISLLFVGRTEASKGTGRVLQIALELKESGVDFTLDLVGDGPERPDYEQWVKDYGLGSQVTFHGWLPKPALVPFYRQAHFFLFPTTASEGWPKVLSEAMAFGVVPLAGAVSSIPQILAETGAGLPLPPLDIQVYARTVTDFLEHPEKWQAFSRAGMMEASRFTYDNYLREVTLMFKEAWGVGL